MSAKFYGIFIYFCVLNPKIIFVFDLKQGGRRDNDILEFFKITLPGYIPKILLIYFEMSKLKFTMSLIFK